MPGEGLGQDGMGGPLGGAAPQYEGNWGTREGTQSTTVKPRWLERLVHLQLGTVASSPTPGHRRTIPRAWKAR